MTCSQIICVKPVRGVIPMPENDHRCMPVEGCAVPFSAYYRNLLKRGDIVQIDCATGGMLPAAEWAGKKMGSFSHTFSGAQVLNLGSLLAQSGGGNTGVYALDIDVRTSPMGVLLQRGNGTDPLQEGDSRHWSGADDGLGNLTNATNFTLVMQAGDTVVFNWVETK